VYALGPAELADSARLAESSQRCLSPGSRRDTSMPQPGVKVTSLGLFILDTFEYNDENGKPVSPPRRSSTCPARPVVDS
jgi:hypothetical protein